MQLYYVQIVLNSAWFRIRDSLAAGEFKETRDCGKVGYGLCQFRWGVHCVCDTSQSIQFTGLKCACMHASQCVSDCLFILLSFIE